MPSTEQRSATQRRGLIIVITLATAYVASHFFRASNVTIGLDLMRDLSIGPEALGGLTGAFFFGFAAMQLPCGLFFDRYGPRRTIAGMLILATLGGVVFTLAPTWPMLLTGRVLMGAGFGAMFIGPAAHSVSVFNPATRPLLNDRPNLLVQPKPCSSSVAPSGSGPTYFAGSAAPWHFPNVCPPAVSATVS